MAVDVFFEKKDDTQNNPWPARTSLWSKAFERFCRAVLKRYCPLTVRGAEKLPPVPFMICSNHASHLDSAILMLASGVPFSDTGLIAAKDYFFDQSHRFLLHYMMNLVPIARGSGSGAINDSIVASRSFLKAGGKILIIYPEGTRTRDGQIGRFKQGAAILARDLDIPIVPAFITGSFQAWPKGKNFIKPKKLSVTFGEPMRVDDWVLGPDKYDRKAIFNAYRDATEELERRVRALKALGER